MRIYDTLNDRQQEAVFHTEGSLLILAGAGSGKTRVLTHRIAYLIGEKGISPWNIMAITFTNKAAEEMRQRVDKIVGFGADSIWVSTFHSACVRILRRYIDRLGFDTNFTIYDTDDQKTLMKDLCKQLEIDTKMLKERTILAEISHAKERAESPDEYERSNRGDYRCRKIAMVYRAYQEQLQKNNALDFDDLLVKAVELFEKNPDVLEHYQERYRYLMVDEYQDTNHIQFRLVSLLAEKYKNLCVVGDDDQSIYKFRGANIGNILDFEQAFPGARVIRLEQNYRSTQMILNAANEVIANNTERKEKTLWTENAEGSPVHFRRFNNAFEEAEYVVGDIQKKRREGVVQYKDCAILYRTNAQSRMFEEKFLMANVPYKMVGGVNFYARKEIKDLICYLKTIDNARDDLAVRRILNVPKRGIGLATVGKLQNYADVNEISFFDALAEADKLPSLKRSLKKLQDFVSMIQALRTKAEEYTVRELLEDIIEQTGYVEELRMEDTIEARSRIENIDELISKTQIYQETCEKRGEKGSLNGFLEEIALIADIDTVDPDQDYVLLMTLHSAKGLEFPHVYMTGMDDGLFPGFLSMEEDEELQEERRLCYVGITRAMKELTMTSARTRMARGEMQVYGVSRFVKEIPREYVELGGSQKENKSVFSMGQSFSSKGQNFSSMGQSISFEGLPFSSPGQGFSGQASSLEYMKRSVQYKALQPKTFTTTSKAAGLEYEVGDRVRHIRFGVGIVKGIRDGGRDYEVTVEFDRAGQKKMFAGFANLEKIE